MCNVLDVSVSGYRAWKRGGTLDRKRLTDCQMLALFCPIYKEFKGLRRWCVSSGVGSS